MAWAELATVTSVAWDDAPVLANLLPGVRELRTPLVTGYLYFAAAWIWVGSAWVSDASDNTALRHLREMAERVGPAGVAVASGFLAYLLGSLLTVGTTVWIKVIAGLPEWVIWSLYRREKRFHNILRERIWPSSLSRRFDLQRRISDLDRGRQPFERDTSSMDGWIREQIGDLGRRGWTARRILGSQRVPESIARWASDMFEHRGIGEADDERIRRDEDYAVARAVERAFGQVIGAEREAVLIRMQIEREALYDGYQRLVSESELRTSIFVPLSVCIAGLAWFWNPFFALLLVGPWVLARRGLVLANEADERVTQALTTGVVQSPVVKSMFDLGTYTATEETGTSNVPASPIEPCTSPEHRSGLGLAMPSKMRPRVPVERMADSVAQWTPAVLPTGWPLVTTVLGFGGAIVQLRLSQADSRRAREQVREGCFRRSGP